MAREIKGFKLDAPRGQVLREVQQAKSQRIKSQKQARQARASGEREAAQTDTTWSQQEIKV